jgi:predicted PurR-regulated permease PerM
VAEIPPERRYRTDPVAAGQSFRMFVVVTVIAAGLYIGREIFVPLALATLLSFALGPPMLLLRRWHVGRVLSVAIVVTIAFFGIFALGAVMTSQLASLAEKLPAYQTNIEAKIRSFHALGAGGSLVERASTMLKGLRAEIEKSEEKKTAPGGAEDRSMRSREAPVPVVIRQPEPASLQVIQSIMGPLIEPLATTGIVIIVVIFMLLGREDLRDRLIRLAGAHDLQRTTEALDDAARRVSRYLLMQLLINATYGLPIGVGLWLIGIPNAVLWGLLAMVLRFIPYIGPWIAALVPIALSIAVDPGWSLLLWTVGLFLAMELISNNVIEPWLYRSSTGLSSVAIIIAAVFWTWLWGPIGLLLATPLTVCLVVLGRHVPNLEFLDVLLGNEPVLSPAQRFYQRMLAGDPDEATELAETYLKEHPRAAFYDEVVIGALALAQQDRERGALEHDRVLVVAESAEATLANLEEVAVGPEETKLGGPGDVPGGSTHAPSGGVLCIAGRRDFDRVAALYLADLLGREKIPVQIVSAEAAVLRNTGAFDPTNIRIVCLSYMSSSSLSHARYLVPRIRRSLPDVPIIAGFWALTEAQAARRDPVATTGAATVATSMRQAISEIRKALRPEVGQPPQPEPADAEPGMGGPVESRRASEPVVALAAARASSRSAGV